MYEANEKAETSVNENKEYTYICFAARLIVVQVEKGTENKYHYMISDHLSSINTLVDAYKEHLNKQSQNINSEKMTLTPYFEGGGQGHIETNKKDSAEDVAKFKKKMRDRGFNSPIYKIEKDDSL